MATVHAWERKQRVTCIGAIMEEPSRMSIRRTPETGRAVRVIKGNHPRNGGKACLRSDPHHGTPYLTVWLIGQNRPREHRTQVPGRSDLGKSLSFGNSPRIRAATS